jgi:hypothetical protein
MPISIDVLPVWLTLARKVVRRVDRLPGVTVDRQRDDGTGVAAGEARHLVGARIVPPCVAEVRVSGVINTVIADGSVVHRLSG